MPDAVVANEGWGWPLLAKKAHYFVGTTALCNKWMYGGELSGEPDKPGPDDCVACARLAKKRVQPADPSPLP